MDDSKEYHQRSHIPGVAMVVLAQTAYETVQVALNLISVQHPSQEEKRMTRGR